MTRTGYICMIVIMLMSAGGVLFCGLKNRGDTSSGAARHLPLKGKARDQELPTVIGEPVVFRTAELRFVTCKASMDLDGFSDEWGIDIETKEGRDELNKLSKQELAYLLAEQLLGSKAIRFSMGGHTRYAELRAVMPEGSGT